MKYCILAGIGGLAAGFAAGWFIGKAVAERNTAIDEQAIWDEAKEHYISKSEKSPVEESVKTMPKVTQEKAPLSEYTKHLKSLGYGVRTDDIPERHTRINDEKPEIELVGEQDFGYEDEYETVTWRYYTNDILADEQNEIVDDREDQVGTDWVNQFDENDAVYVVNHSLKVYIEILKSLDEYPIEDRPMRIEVG